IADRSGPRKPWVFGFGALFFIGSYGLWWAEPGMSNLYWIYLAFLAAFIGAEYIIVFTNSILPDLVPREEVGKISGYGWAVGYVGGVFALVVMLLFMVTPPGESLTILGNAPIFGLDADKAEGYRAAGPLSAIWFVVFAIPFFLFTPDRRTDVPVGKAAVAGATGLRAMWQQIKPHPEIWMFYGASLLYRDALVVLYSFGAIYASGALGWGQMDLLIFGIVAAIAGALGAWIGGWVDGRIGSMPVVTFSIIALLLVTVAVLTITKDSVLMMPVEEGSNLPTIAFIICGAVIGAAGGSMQASSRALVVEFVSGKLTMTEAYGIYAMAGKATAFVGPFLVAVVTTLSDSNRIGLTPIIPILLVGYFVLVMARKRLAAT
ncbi:MAG: MFS transporter, partial [Rhodobacteraceae bacterium]|nr:MFS transporter [Paracoccaceae bacterium]